MPEKSDNEALILIGAGIIIGAAFIFFSNAQAAISGAGTVTTTGNTIAASATITAAGVTGRDSNANRIITQAGYRVHQMVY